MGLVFKRREPSSLKVGANKLFYQNLIKNFISDPCTVVFWDGEETKFGAGESKFTLTMHEPVPLSDIIADPSVAFGKAYMHKTIDTDTNLQIVFESFFKDLKSKESFFSNNICIDIVKRVSNNIRKSRQNAEHHYDIGNDFYKLWLDETMTYSCGYFESQQDTLVQAQINKVNHILKKLDLREGHTLLDIGCGWGQLILTAAKQFGVKSLGVTLSSEQFSKVKRRIVEEGLQDLVEVELIDYREIESRQFDRVVSVGMIEHVGKDRLGEYFSRIKNLLKPGGVSLVHSITGVYEGGDNPWINQYIFPGGYIPAFKELIDEISDQQFFVLDVESLRRHYGKTLENWARNFEAALPVIEQNKDETFIRMWRLYLNSCAASFNCGNIDVHQILFAKDIDNQLPWTRKYIYDREACRGKVVY